MFATIRVMHGSDSGAVAALLPDLGYSAGADQIHSRLLALRDWPDQEAFVAELSGVVVGLCQVQGVRLLASDGYAEVQTLVVSASRQRLGIGKALLFHAIEWAQGKGYERVRLRSGLHRETAHRFYEAAGFSCSKPSYAFEVKRVQNDAQPHLWADPPMAVRLS